jgi:hypothetical protein
MDMTHVELVSTITSAVRGHGAAAALAELRASRPAFTTVGYHDTAAVFTVWAVDRLIAAGRTDRQILWHPLTDARSMQAWWDDATLASDAARDGFVPSTVALVGDPVPCEPAELAPAA